MTIKLFVRPKPPASRQVGSLEWALYSFGGERVGGGVSDQESLAQLVAQHDLDDIWVHFIVPASDISYCKATIPARQARFVQQALPYAVEEAIAEDIEDMFLVPGEKLDKETYPVYAINRDRMRQWYQLATSLGFPLYGIFVDAQLLEGDRASLTVLFDENDVLVSSLGQQCLRTSRANLLPFLELCQSQVSEKKEANILVPEELADDIQVELAQLEHVDGLKPDIDRFSATPFEVLCASYFKNDNSVNFCCQEFASTASQQSEGLRRWWPVAAVASLWFVLQVGIDLTQGMLHQQQAEEYRQQSVTLYKRLFPAEKNVFSPRRQMEGKLVNATDTVGEASFLAMLGEAGFRLSQQPNKDRMRFNNIQFSEQRGELAIEVSAPALSDLDRFKQALGQEGYQVTIGSAVREENSVRGRITMRSNS